MANAYNQCMNKIKMNITFEIVEDELLDSTSESNHEARDVIIDALEQFIVNNHGMITPKRVQIAAKLLSDVHK